VSWLHVGDFTAIIRACLAEAALAGVVHATSPNPVTNAQLMSELRHALHRPPAPPTPAWLLRLGAALLRSDPALALTGRRCVPRALLDAGFKFTHPDLRPALADLLARA
jgi:NAD dependent epimerase/dehydratase family enzyme